MERERATDRTRKFPASLSEAPKCVTSGNRAKASRSLIMEVSAPAVRPSRGREQLSGKLPATEARHAALDLS
jgi:hypothetical protein